MLKSSIVAAMMLAVALLVPAGAKQAEAMPAAKPAVNDTALKHNVGRWGRGFRGRGFRRFRGHGFRRFRGRRFGGVRLRLHRGFYPRRFNRRRHYGHRYYRPRHRHHYSGRSCRHLKRRYRHTHNRYWWDQYKACKFGYY